MAISRYDREVAGLLGRKAELQVAPAPPARPIVTFTRLDQIKPEPLEPVIDGYLYADTLGSIVGKSGSCKSFLAVAMASSVAAGMPFLGRRTPQGAVFYLAGEGQVGLRKRFTAWSQFNGIGLEGVPLYIASGLPALTEITNVAGTLDAMMKIADEVFFNAGGVEPRLVVVDTMARAMAGADENSAADVGRLIEGLDWIRSQFKCCVELVHHVGHGENAAARGRGSSAYYAALDSELLVTSDGGQVVVRSTKAKDWAPPPEVLFDRHVVEVDLDGARETTLVLDRATDSTAGADLVLDARILELRKTLSVRQVQAELCITKWRVECGEKRAKQRAAFRVGDDG